ncbi:RNA 2',3'-cyclic phosphodiesterase [Cytobacillus sp.]|uniref:RNA 2',3'-cyclic phosphodiesterase n=1 Tax=Cytobacillus sp. TaxID=2675269 RepID=UPI0028BD569A|nr:RNA 2',3'-cyclic phosphodiesterase [Cytobacillus sp.]
MEQSTHFFFAVSLPEEVKKELHKQCLAIKERFPFQRWVHQEDYHITLAFLGAAAEDKLEKAKKLVMTALNGQKAFPLQINQLGVFGKVDSPRIFWADTAKEERLNTIRSIVFSACLEAGFKLETRAFKSHITLARKWVGNHPFEVKHLKNHPFEKAPLAFQAKEVVLYQTHIDRIPKYEKIAAFPLLEE